MAAEVGQAGPLERTEVGGLEHHRRGDPGGQRLEPPIGADAPPVAGLEPGEADRGLGRREIVAVRPAEVEELLGDLGADHVGTEILGTGVATAVSVKTGERSVAAGLEGSAEDVGGHRSIPAENERLAAHGANPYVPAVPSALVTDLYELTMAASYLRRGMTGRATFSLFVRSLPPERGFLVAAGLEPCLDYLESLRFSPEDLKALEDIGLDRWSIDALEGLSFTGTVRAVPEGRVVFAGEPLLEVEGPLPEAQLVESYLLNQVTLHTVLTTKAARCATAVGGRVELVEFGLRRAQGVEAAMAAARGATIAGFTGTSNVAAAHGLGTVPSGTMAHSFVQAFPEEIAAFRAFVEDWPERAVLLVDTYDTMTGVERAAEVIAEHGLANRAAVRIDSGDLVDLARAARRLLDRRGLDDVKIFVTGGLDEHELARLIERDAPIDLAGVGSMLAVSADAPTIDSVYKLVEIEGRPVVKRSIGKVTEPGGKQVWRRGSGEALSDLVGRRDEEPPLGGEPMLHPVMNDGRRTRPAPPLTDARRRLGEDLARLPERTRRLEGATPVVPELSGALRELAAEVAARPS